MAITGAKKCAELEEELAKAKDLKDILNQLAQRDNKIQFTTPSGLFTDSCGGVGIDDSVAVYVDDFFGGKVIKQEATPVIRISKGGNIERGYTKQKPDKSYTYRLIRE